jgi:hypothetical protein
MRRVWTLCLATNKYSFGVMRDVASLERSRPACQQKRSDEWDTTHTSRADPSTPLDQRCRFAGRRIRNQMAPASNCSQALPGRRIPAVRRNFSRCSKKKRAPIIIRAWSSCGYCAGRLKSTSRRLHTFWIRETQFISTLPCPPLTGESAASRVGASGDRSMTIAQREA